MKLFTLSKDGGPESRVWGYFLIEWKALFSIVLLHFKDGSREAYHSHAFNCISWVLRGKLTEYNLSGPTKVYPPSIWPVRTYRDTFHQVHSDKDTWVLSFRGPWAKTWMEYIPATDEVLTLTNGRQVVARERGPHL